MRIDDVLCMERRTDEMFSHLISNYGEQHWMKLQKLGLFFFF